MASQEATAAKSDPDPLRPKGYTAGKVFATPELLEAILLNLSTRQLFGVQRISKAFNETIHGSIKLQRAMFLKLDPSITYDRENPDLNPLLYELAFVPGRKLREAGAHGMALYEEDDGDDDDFQQQPNRLSLIFKASSTTIWTRKSTEIHKYRRRGKKQVLIDQSWRHTLLCQGSFADLGVTMWVDDVINDGIEEPIDSIEWGNLADEGDEQHASDERLTHGETREDVTLGEVLDNLEDTLQTEFKEEEEFSADGEYIDEAYEEHIGR